jgi:hypothetical protein
MATPPDFTAGQILTAAQMNAVGLWLVKSQTIGTTVSSVAVTGAFSADYDAYKIIVSGGVGSTSSLLQMYFGTSAPANGYYGGVVLMPFVSGGTPTNLGINNAGVINRIGFGTTNSIHGSVEVLNPFTTQNTIFTANFASHVTGGDSGTFSGFVNDSTSYTGFTILPNSGTISGGTISVYGYRK